MCHWRIVNNKQNKYVRQCQASGKYEEKDGRDFPGGPMVKTSPSNAAGASSISNWKAKIPYASQPKYQT